jgi:hypothetical protein
MNDALSFKIILYLKATIISVFGNLITFGKKGCENTQWVEYIHCTSIKNYCVVIACARLFHQKYETHVSLYFLIYWRK